MPADPLAQVRRHHVDIVLDHRGLLGSLNDQLGEILVEDVPDDPDHQVGFAVEQCGGGGLRRLAADVLPLGRQPSDVPGEFLLAGALRRRSNDHSAVLRSDLLEDRLQAGAFGIGELPADPRVLPIRHVDQISTRQTHLAGQASTLVSHRVLGNLDDDRLTRLQNLLDLTRPPVEPGGVVVDLPGVENRIAALADVDERRLHARKHVLNPTEIDVSGIRPGTCPGHEMLDKHSVLKHRDLRAVTGVAHDHASLDRLATGQELGFGDDRRTAAAVVPALLATLALGLQPGRTADPAHLVVPNAAFANVYNRDRRVVRGDVVRDRGAIPATPPTAPARASHRLVLVVSARRRPGAFGIGVVEVIGLAGLAGLVRRAGITGIDTA